MVEPTYMPIIGYPQAWSGSTEGKVTGEAILAANPTTMAEMDKLHGTLKGKIVLLGTGPLDLAFPETALGTRYTDAELAGLVPEAFSTGAGRGGAGRGGRGNGPQLSQEEQAAVTARLATFWKDEGVLLTISSGATTRSSGGVVSASNGSSRTGDPTKNLPSVAITAENYNRIARLLEHNVPVKLTFDVKVGVRHDQDRLLQRGRRNSRRDQAERNRDGRRALRFLAHGHRRHRQRRGQRRRHGSDAHPEIAQPQDGSHGSPGPVGRRRRRPAGLARPT